MTGLERAVVVRKLEHLHELLALLRAESTTSLEAFLLDRRQQLLVERLLHLSVEAASDALEHLLVQGCNKRPQTYAETFLEAGAMGLISVAWSWPSAWCPPQDCATGLCTTMKPLTLNGYMPPSRSHCGISRNWVRLWQPEWQCDRSKPASRRAP